MLGSILITAAILLHSEIKWAEVEMLYEYELALLGCTQP